MAAAPRVFAQQTRQGGASTLVIRGGIVHSVDNPLGEARDIVIEGDTIADIVAPGSVTNVDAEFLDAARRLVVPGLINAHTHSHGGLSKGVGDLWSLELLLNAAPWIGGSRRAEDKYLAALINAIEHVEKGSTACYDLFFEFPAPTVEGMEAVASAYEKVGLRAVIAPMVADLTFYQSLPGLIEALPEDTRPRASDLRMSSADASLAALRMIAKRWSYPADRLRLGIAPSIPQHCTREFMIGCRDIAREHGIVMQTHVSESRYLSASSFRFAGMSMTETMDACGIVGPWFSAAHACGSMTRTWRCSPARAPRSPIIRGPTCGSVPAWQRCANMCATAFQWASARTARPRRTTRTCSRRCVLQPSCVAHPRPAPSGVDFGRRGFWHGDGRFRSRAWHAGFHRAIAKGYKADLVLIDLDSVNYVPLNNATNQLVFTEDGTAVDKVLIGGRLVVSGGRAIGIDRAALARQAGEAVERLSALNADARRFAERIEPMVSNFCRGLADDEAMHRLRRDIPAR
jgi:guanine deaminase